MMIRYFCLIYGPKISPASAKLSVRDQFNVLNLPNVLFRKESVLLKPDVV